MFICYELDGVCIRNIQMSISDLSSGDEKHAHVEPRLYSHHQTWVDRDFDEGESQFSKHTNIR